MVSTMNAVRLQRKQHPKPCGESYPTQMWSLLQQYGELGTLEQSCPNASNCHMKWDLKHIHRIHSGWPTHAAHLTGEHSTLPLEIRLQTKRKTWKQIDEDNTNWGTRPNGLMRTDENSYWFWFFLKSTRYSFSLLDTPTLMSVRHANALKAFSTAPMAA